MLERMALAFIGPSRSDTSHRRCVAFFTMVCFPMLYASSKLQPLETRAQRRRSWSGCTAVSSDCTRISRPQSSRWLPLWSWPSSSKRAPRSRRLRRRRGARRASSAGGRQPDRGPSSLAAVPRAQARRELDDRSANRQRLRIAGGRRQRQHGGDRRRPGATVKFRTTAAVWKRVVRPLVMSTRPTPAIAAPAMFTCGVRGRAGRTLPAGPLVLPRLINAS